MDDRDKGLTSIAWPGYPNLIIWNADNQFVVDAVKELFEEKKIKLQPADALIYAMEGRLPGMEPITSEKFKKVTKQGYKFKKMSFTGFLLLLILEDNDDDGPSYITE